MLSYVYIRQSLYRGSRFTTRIMDHVQNKASLLRYSKQQRFGLSPQFAMDYSPRYKRTYIRPLGFLFLLVDNIINDGELYSSFFKEKVSKNLSFLCNWVIKYKTRAIKLSNQQNICN